MKLNNIELTSAKDLIKSVMVPDSDDNNTDVEEDKGLQIYKVFEELNPR